MERAVRFGQLPRVQDDGIGRPRPRRRPRRAERWVLRRARFRRCAPDPAHREGFGSGGDERRGRRDPDLGDRRPACGRANDRRNPEPGGRRPRRERRLHRGRPRGRGCRGSRLGDRRRRLGSARRGGRSRLLGSGCGRGLGRRRRFGRCSGRHRRRGRLSRGHGGRCCFDGRIRVDEVWVLSCRRWCRGGRRRDGSCRRLRRRRSRRRVERRRRVVRPRRRRRVAGRGIRRRAGRTRRSTLRRRRGRLGRSGRGRLGGRRILRTGRRGRRVRRGRSRHRRGFRRQRRGRRNRGLARREQRQRVDISVRVVGSPNAEEDERHREVGRAARADGANGLSFGHGLTAAHAVGAEVDERHRPAAGGANGHGAAVRRQRPCVGDDARGGRGDGCAGRCTDVDPPVLATVVRMRGVEHERAQNGPVDGPGPR